MVVFVVGLLLVAYTSARNIRSETATSDCQTQLRTLKLAASQYQARTDAFPPDKRTLVVADLVAADDVELWDLSFTQGDKAPTYRAVGGTCA